MLLSGRPATLIGHSASRSSIRDIGNGRPRLQRVTATFVRAIPPTRRSLSRSPARREGERNRKMFAGTVSRAREACPRSRVRTRLRVEQMWVQHRQYTRPQPERVMSFVPRGNSVLYLRQSTLITIAIFARTIGPDIRPISCGVFVAERL